MACVEKYKYSYVTVWKLKTKKDVPHSISPVIRQDGASWRHNQPKMLFYAMEPYSKSVEISTMTINKKSITVLITTNTVNGKIIKSYYSGDVPSLNGMIQFSVIDENGVEQGSKLLDFYRAPSETSIFTCL